MRSDGAVRTPGPEGAVDEPACEESAGVRVRSRVRQRLKRLASIDERSLAVFRVGIAIAVLVDLILRAGDLGSLYSDAGALPRSLAAADSSLSSHVFPLYFFNGSALWAGALLVLTGITATTLLVGYRSFSSTAATWYLISCLHARSSTLTLAGDDLLRMLLLWGLVLPLGASGSIDDRLARPSARSRTVSIASLVVLVHLSALLFFTPLVAAQRGSKLLTIGLVDALEVDHLVTGWGATLRRVPDIVGYADLSLAGLLILGTILLWSPIATAQLRSLVVLFLVQLQILGVAPAFHLGSQPWVAACGLMLFAPTWLWNQFTEASQAAVQPVTQTSGAPRSTSGRDLAAAGLAIVALGSLLQTALPASVNEGATSTLAIVSRQLGIQPTPLVLATVPPTDDGWLATRGQLANGSSVDPLRRRQFSYEEPEDSPEIPGGARWRRHLRWLSTDGPIGMRSALLGYLCHRWNTSHEAGSALLDIQLILMLEGQDGEEGVSTALPVPLAQHRCER